MTDPVTPVIVSLMQPLNTTVNGPVPLLTVTVKSRDEPTQVVAAPGEITQLGLGFTINCAVQLLVHPKLSVTVAV